MEKLKNIIAYFCLNYPYPKELSKARLVKMLYLADWKNAIENDTQLTNTKWIFNQYGPYVNDIIETLKLDKRFEIIDEINPYGAPKQLIQLKEPESFTINLNTTESTILDFVINATFPLNYADFINLTYSTYPIKVSTRMSELDLVNLAKDYNKIRLKKVLHQ